MKSPSTSIWLRRPGESAEAYLAFRAYLEMGPGRSVAEAYRHAKGKPQAQQAPGVWKAWVAKYDWHNRAAAWDTNNDITTQIAREAALADEAAKWAKRQAQVREEGWTLYEALKTKAARMLQFPVERTKIQGKETVIEPADWNFNTAAKLADTALKLGRLTAELSTANIHVDDIPWDDLSPEENDDLANGKPVGYVLRCYRARKAATAQTA